MRSLFRWSFFVSVFAGCASIPSTEGQAWFVLRGSMLNMNMGQKVDVYLDGNRIGELPNDGAGPYLAVKVPPGKHNVCTRMPSFGPECEAMTFDALAGKRHYFLIQTPNSNIQAALSQKPSVSAIDETLALAAIKEETMQYKMFKEFDSKFNQR